MDTRSLIDDLSRTEAADDRATAVEVRQTHASVVFLRAGRAFKVKKPVDLGFLDYSTPAKRERACHDEVRLNRRLAPSVYLGVTPVTREAGHLRFGGTGTPVDWAVVMRRLPEERNLRSLLARGELDGPLIDRVAERLAGFHATADRGEGISANACWEVVARNCRENLEVGERFRGKTVSLRVLERLREATERELAERRALVEARVRRGEARDGHGDLRLDHVYVLADRPPPEDLLVIDCIEFNDRFRHQDPVADIAFLVMELGFVGRDDLAERLAHAWLEARGDDDGHHLLRLFVSYRHAVRGKVRSIESADAEIDGGARERALETARAHFLAALATLEAATRRPALLLVGGLPGTGKSTLARGLAREAGFLHLATDLVRKELAGLSPEESGGQAFGEGIYTREWTDRTYAECAARARSALFEGHRVIVDATFSEESRRADLLALARRCGVPGLLILCTVDAEEAHRRLAARRGDVSDAGWDVYQRMAAAWPTPRGEVARNARTIDTGGRPEDGLARALEVLARAGLA